jgi:GT2 family glycosyltransferase
LKQALIKIKKYKEKHSLKETILWFYNAVKYKLMKKNYSSNFNKINLSVNSKKNINVKSMPKIYIFSIFPYYYNGGGNRSSQIAKTFNNIGYQVYYIYYKETKKNEKLSIPMPLSMHQNINNINNINISKKDIMIFEAPIKKYKEYLDLAKINESYIIYENIENINNLLQKKITDIKTLNDFIINSSLITCNSEYLINQIKDYCKKLQIKKEIIYLPNAVDNNLFSPLINYEKPMDMTTGIKTLLFYGSLNSKIIDWNFLFEFANRNIKYSIIIIGDYKCIDNIVKNSPINIHFLGLKKQYEIPAYINYSDYTILPIKIGVYQEYIPFIKIFEYISMNKITISTKIKSMEKFPNVFSGNTIEDWEKIIHNSPMVISNESEKFTEKNTWNDRISFLIDNFEKNNTYRQKFYNNISIIILNYNNKNIICKCIDSLIKFNERYNYEIIIIDNQSNDGSYEQIINMYCDNVKIYKNNKNGCSSGRNLGVKKSKGEYILFLDSDQWATNKYWLDSYFEVMKTAQNVGMIGWTAGWFNKKGVAYYTVDSFPYKYMPQNALCRKDVGYLGSGGMFLAKKTFNDVDGFDLNYDPTCYEDTDLSLKIRNAGKELYYCPYLGIVHLPHQTTNAGSEEHKKLTNKNQKYFTQKWKKINSKLLKYTK